MSARNMCLVRWTPTVNQRHTWPHSKQHEHSSFKKEKEMSIKQYLQPCAEPQ